MTDKQITTYCDDVKETALRQFYKIQNQRKEISLLHKKCTLQQAEIEDLNHSIDTLGRVKEQLKENLSETEAKYQKEITRLDALLVCKNKVIRNLEKSFENAYDGAIKEFAERLKNIYINDKRYDRPDAHTLIGWLFANIDNLVKEMVGEDK